MGLFGGRSSFGMAIGSRGRHKARRNMPSPSNEREQEVIEPGVQACESLPGELRRRKMSLEEEPRHDNRASIRLFGVNTAGAPRLKGAKKFTK